jgi:hypothetical protein
MKQAFVVAVAIAAVCAATCVRADSAQETINYASIAGRITDPQGAVVPGAIVSARHADTNVSGEAVTDEAGRFRFPYLRVGPYEITVRAPGFADATRQLALTVGSAFDVAISLSVRALEASVDVRGGAAVLETARTQIAGTISQAEVKDLPMNGRNFLDLALLVPGVAPTNVASAQLFAETSAVPGAGLSIGSQRNFSNNFIVDGLSANDDAAGLSGMPYGVDAVEQFQVVTSGGQAELGRALGGYVNVVTKSGTNTARGDAYAYLRDTSLNAVNPLTGTKLPMDQEQYGVSFGGPLVRDRTFFFTNFEQRLLDQTGVTTIGEPTALAINSRLRAVGYPGLPLLTGQYPNPVRSANLTAKVDHQPTIGDQLNVRYSLYRVSSDNSRGAGGMISPTASAGLENLDQTLAFGNTLSLSPRTVNETRAQVAYGDLRASPTDGIGPAVGIAGVASFGTLSTSPTRRVNTLYQIVDNVSHQAGAHALRGGVDFLFNDDTITFPRSLRGAYTFSSLDSFLAGVYNNAGFTQTFGATTVSQTNPNVGMYVQDEWRAGSGLTVNAGLRYDLQFLETIDTDTNNLSPRLGLAWSPSRRTVVRGSAGLYYDRVPLRALANALLSAGNTTDLSRLAQINVSLSPSQSGAPAFPNILAAPVPSVTLPNLTTMDRNLQNAHSRQVGAEIEQQVGDRTTISAGYQHVRGVDLMILINQNVPACAATGINNGCRPNSTYANNSRYSSAASSSYHGLHVSLVQRPAAWGHYRVTYTLSKAMDNVGEFFFSSPIDPFDLSKDWGRSDDDQRHRLVFNGAINSPTDPAHTWWDRLSHGLRLSSTLQYYSALPLNITSGVTTIQGTGGRPLLNGAFIGRNSGVGPDFFSWSARLSRTFKVRARVEIEALAEAFNLTNRSNAVTVNGNFGSGAYPDRPAATFGQTTAVADPRTIQVGLRARF